ncbi:MAG: CPBP family intramembrane metalloprotease [Rubrobacter sp.]|nr:CPBP family intramembrane metalloprotease [Rubrobacter sp.]
MSTTVAERPGAPREGLLARYPLVFFFIIAFAGTWLLELPYLRFADGAGLLPFGWPIPFVVGGVIPPFTGPFLAGFIMAGVTEGRAGILRWLRRIVLWRVGLRWYLFALIGIPAVMVLGAIVLPGVLASYQTPDLSLVLAYPVSFIVSTIIGGPLGEEPGWRGFALPRLQRLYGPLIGSLILGPLHVFWHLPLYWLPEWGTPRDTFLDLVWYFLAGFAATFIYTWLFNNTRGSVLLAILMHGSFDAFFVERLFLAPIAASLLGLTIGLGVLALLLIILTRGRLGYERYLQEVEEEPESTTAQT